MPKLTPQQIQSLLTQAQLAGLDRADLDALQETLMMQSADLTAEQRFNLELMQTPEDTQERVTAFTEGYSKLSAGIMSKGKSALMAMSDEEWERLTNGASNEQ